MQIAAKGQEKRALEKSSALLYNISRSIRKKNFRLPSVLIMEIASKLWTVWDAISFC